MFHGLSLSYLFESLMIGDYSHPYEHRSIQHRYESEDGRPVYQNPFRPIGILGLKLLNRKLKHGKDHAQHSIS